MNFGGFLDSNSGGGGGGGVAGIPYSNGGSNIISPGSILNNGNNSSNNNMASGALAQPRLVSPSLQTSKPMFNSPGLSLALDEGADDIKEAAPKTGTSEEQK